MSFTPETDNRDLHRRIDQIEARLESLEVVVFDEVAEPEFPETGQWQTTAASDFATSAASDFATSAAKGVATSAASDVAPSPTPSADVVVETTSDPLTPDSASRAHPASERADLRTLQAAATADIPFTPPPAAPSPSGPAFDLRDIEERLAGKALALVGGTALLLGAVFFLSLAFSRGWITPEMQVVLGLLGGSIGLSIGAFLLGRGEQIVGHVLTAVGLAVISLSLFAATSLYGLVEPTLALAGVLVAAAATTGIAIRSDSQVVAGFGLVAALAAPPIMGAEPDLITVAYMAVVLVGIAAISLARTWPWLPPVAFLLSVPQLYQWIATEPDAVLSVPALLAYWGVLTAAAGGESFRGGRRELSLTSAPLFLAVGASVIGLGFIVLPSDSERAAFLLVLALLHGLLTALFARRRGLLDPFGLLAGAYGLAMATAAVPMLFSASATSIVWAAEAAALATLAGRRGHGPALIAASVLYVLAAAHIGRESLLLSPLGASAGLQLATGTTLSVVASFAFFAAVGAALLFLVQVRAVQLPVAGLVGLVALPLSYLLFDGAAAVTVWMTTAVATIGALRWVDLLPVRRIRWRLGPALRWLKPAAVEAEPGAALLPIFTGVLAIGLAVVATASALLDHYGLPGVPFTDQAGLSGLALAIGFVAVGIVAGGRANLRRGLFAAGLAIGIVSLTQLAAPWYVLVWAGLAMGAASMSTIDGSGTLSYRVMALLSLVVLAVLAIIEAPPTRLVVGWDGVAPHPLFLSGASLALGSLVVGLGVVAAISRTTWPARTVDGVAVAAGVVALYLLSIGVVDVFAGEAYELTYRQATRLDELTKEAQVALSVLWTAVGVLVLGLGLLLRRMELRVAGLAVLALATVKVFLVDLSALDVAYRVITLIVLGLLLVVSAYAWNRMKPGGTAGPEGGPRRGYGAAGSAGH